KDGAQRAVGGAEEEADDDNGEVEHRNIAGVNEQPHGHGPDGEEDIADEEGALAADAVGEFAEVQGGDQPGGGAGERYGEGIGAFIADVLGAVGDEIRDNEVADGVIGGEDQGALEHGGPVVFK